MADNRKNIKQYLGRDSLAIKEKKERYSSTDVIAILLSGIFILTAFIYLHKFYMIEMSGLAQEIHSAVLGAVVTVVAMALVLKMQTRSEKEKEYSGKVFEQKLTMYKGFLDAAFHSDDDNILEQEEIGNLENMAGSISLMASDNLVSVLSQFIYQLKTFGVMYERSLSEPQRQHFAELVQSGEMKLSLSRRTQKKSPEDADVLANIRWYFVTLDDVIQAMRSDLSVVDGNVRNVVENFVQPKYDHKKLIRDPNLIDPPESKAA